MLTIVIHQPEPLQLECSWCMFMFLDHCKTNPFYLILQQTINAYAANYCVSVERAVTSGWGHACGLKLARFMAYRHLLSATAHLQDHPHLRCINESPIINHFIICITIPSTNSVWRPVSQQNHLAKRGPSLQNTDCPSRCQRQQVEEPREAARPWSAISASDLPALAP